MVETSDEDDVVFIKQTPPPSKRRKKTAAVSSSSEIKAEQKPLNDSDAGQEMICTSCGEKGHWRGACLNKWSNIPCYICARIGHNGDNCPNIPCEKCLLTGHEAKNCTSPPLERMCFVCGRTGHLTDNCPINHDEFRNVRCMSCLELGHSACIPLCRPSGNEFYCANCGGKHIFRKCKKPFSIIDFSSPLDDVVGEGVKCRRCHQIGHLEEDCKVDFHIRRINGTISSPNGRFIKNEIIKRNCTFCSLIGHSSSKCPSKKCLYCSKDGHSKKRCPQYKRDKKAFKEKSTVCPYCGKNGHVSMKICSAYKKDQKRKKKSKESAEKANYQFKNVGVCSATPTKMEDGSLEYDVEKLTDKRVVNGVTEYKVKWFGYPTADSTWEPSSNLSHLPGLIKTFEIRSKMQSVLGEMVVKSERKPSYDSASQNTGYDGENKTQPIPAKLPSLDI